MNTLQTVILIVALIPVAVYLLKRLAIFTVLNIPLPRQILLKAADSMMKKTAHRLETQIGSHTVEPMRELRIELMHRVAMGEIRTLNGMKTVGRQFVSRIQNS